MAKKKLNSVLGIDIGSQQIKVVELRVSGREYSISAVGMIPTPPGLVDHTGVYDTDTLGPLIKQLCQEIGATVNQAVFSISGQASILVRTLEVQRMSGSELKEHMEWEISRNIPFAESTVVSDYKTFDPRDASATNLDAVMAIAPQSAIDTLMGIAKKAGKQVHAIDVEPLGLARLLKSAYEGDVTGQTVCVIEVGNKSTAINMYRDGQLLMPRQVPFGGEAFTNAISNAMNISFEEAEQLKIASGRIPEAAAQAPANPFAADATQGFQAYNPFAEEFVAPAAEPEPSYQPPVEPDYSAPVSTDEPQYGVPSAYSEPGESPVYASPFEDAPAAPEPVQETAIEPVVSASSSEETQIYNAMAMEVDEFVAEIRRSVDYYKSRGGDVNRVFITGGGSKLRGLPELVERSVGIPTQVLDSFRGASITAKKLEYGVLEKQAEFFSVAVGNALHIAFD